MKRHFLRLFVVFSVLASLFASVVQAQSGLHAGAAKIDITHPGGPGVFALNEYDHEKLFLRAIVFDNGITKGVLIGADLGGVGDEVWDDASNRIARELGIPREQIIITSTHTHADTPASATPAPGTARYGTEFFADVSLQAVRQAMQNMQPAIAGYSEGEAYLNVNRDAVTKEGVWTQAGNFDAYSDRSVAVLSFAKPGGEPIAAYVAYAMHPVSVYLSGFTSADFPGAMSRYVEKAFGDEMVTIFSQGASGDQNPRWLRAGTNAMASRSDVEITGYEMAREEVEAPIRNREVVAHNPSIEAARELSNYLQALGTILGEEVIRVMSATDYDITAPKIWGSQSVLSCPGRRRLDSGREGMQGVYEDGDDVGLRLSVLGFGDLAIGGGAAEIYSKIGQRVKAESPMTKTMFVTLANGRGTTGYIPDDESFGHNTFQVLGTRLKPGCAEAGISAGIAELVSEYMSQ